MSSIRIEQCGISASLRTMSRSLRENQWGGTFQMENHFLEHDSLTFVFTMAMNTMNRSKGTFQKLLVWIVWHFIHDENLLLGDIVIQDILHQIHVNEIRHTVKGVFIVFVTRKKIRCRFFEEIKGGFFHAVTEIHEEFVGVRCEGVQWVRGRSFARCLKGCVHGHIQIRHGIEELYSIRCYITNNLQNIDNTSMKVMWMTSETPQSYQWKVEDKVLRDTKDIFAFALFCPMLLLIWVAL